MKPDTFASRTTHTAEPMYPQLDLEAMGLDFGLRSFRHYVVGLPEIITVVTVLAVKCLVQSSKKSAQNLYVQNKSK